MAIDLHQTQQISDSRPCILTLDDSKVMLSTLQMLFQKIPQLSKFRLIPCKTTDMAYENLIMEDVALILLDWNLQNDMSGLNFLKRLNSTKVWSDIPVVMVTVEGRKENIMQAIQNGARAYLVKPFDKNNLVEKIISLANTNKYS